MRALRSALAALCLILALPLGAQTCATGWAHVVATKLQNIDRSTGATPNLIPFGTFTIVAQNGNLQSTNFSIPGGGIATLVPRARAVANGGLTQTLCVPRSDLATPNVGYDITVRDNSPSGGNAVVIHLSGVAINAAEWSFDDYLITTPIPWHMYAGLAPIPTGTGFAHVTDGNLDAVARPVDLSGADTVGYLPYNRISGAPSGGGGGGGSSSYQPVGAVPSGTINGTNTVFTLPDAPSGGTLILQYNGQILQPFVGYTLSGSTVTLTTAPRLNSLLYANYFISSSSSSLVPGSEAPSGTIDGSNVTFTLSAAPASGSLLLQLNGQLLQPGYGYNLSGTTITMTTAPRTGASIYANYFH